MSIAILGGGAFGSALAISLAQTGPVTLWMRDETAAARAQETRQVSRLPDATLPDRVAVTHDLGALSTATLALLAIPTQQISPFLSANLPTLPRVPLIACCKGIDMAVGLGPVGLLRQVASDRPVAMLTGPSFAVDLAQNFPTALTLACANTEILHRAQQALTTPNLRIYRTTDTTGAELGGALKNVIAIAAGAAIGAGLGESARAALITRGFAEMQRFAIARGAQPETLSGLSGFGDLVLTCTSERSRNYQFGLSLGRGVPFDSTITVEGRATAEALAGFDDDMPICGAVAALIDGRVDVNTAMHNLLARPLKEE